MKKHTLSQWTLSALFAALTALFTHISLPIGPVPISLATLSVLLSGALLGARWGAFSQLIYLLIGAVGLPVFSGFEGGLQKLVGPTGGYLVGYVVGAFVTGLAVEHFGRTPFAVAVGGALGYASLYITGTAYFMALTDAPLMRALMLCVFPFLFGDGLKIIAGTVLVRRLWPVLSRQMADQTA